MNKLLAIASLPFFSISLFKCTPTSSEKDYAAQYNPTKILGSGNFSYNHVKINEYDYALRGDDNHNEIGKLHDMILGAKYESTSEKSSSDKTFTYTVHKKALIWGYSSYTYTFYYDGYTSICETNGKKDSDGNYLYSTYNYKCPDVKDAEAIYDYVDRIVEAYKEEEKQKDDAAEAANERVNSFVIENVLDYVRNQDKLIMNFYCVDYVSEPDVRYSDSELEDDGSVKELILNTTYTPISSTQSFNTTGRISHLSIGNDTKDENSDEPALSWTLTFDEDDLVATLSVNTKDKFDRSYSKRDKYSIPRVDIHTIFDNAYRLFNAKWTEEKDASGQTSSSSNQ